MTIAESLPARMASKIAKPVWQVMSVTAWCNLDVHLVERLLHPQQMLADRPHQALAVAPRSMSAATGWSLRGVEGAFLLRVPVVLLPAMVFGWIRLDGCTLARNGRKDELAVFNGHFHGFTENRHGGAVITTNRCCSISRGNHDGTTEKGYFLCTARDGAIRRKFVEVRPA